MALFQSYISPSLPHGVYAVSVPPPATILPVGTGVAVEVGQFPWGPSNALTYPGSMGSFWQTFAPAGMSRLGSAHLATIRKGWPLLGGVRVADPAAAVATCVIQTSGSVTVMTVTAKYSGTSGNSIIITIAAPNDGIATHFNFTAQVSSASGTTTEFYPNCNVASSGGAVVPNVTNSVLLASAVYTASGTPANGSTTMGSTTSGTNGTVTSAMYVGTPGGNDKGFALLEADSTINHVFTDDCSSAFRVAVNTGLTAHGLLVQSRMCYLSGNSGQTAAQAQADIVSNSYQSIYNVYTDPWTYVADDTDGTPINIPGSSWAASVAAQIPPSLAISWRASSVSSLLQGISSLEANRSYVRAQNTASGISTLIPSNSGGFTFEASVNTSNVAGQQSIERTRMGIFIAQSAVNAWYPYVDAPNLPFFQQDLVNSANSFLGVLKNNATVNPAALPYIANFAVLPVGSSNTAATIAAGMYNVGAQIQLGSPMSQISLSMQFGATVTVAAA